MEHLKLFPALCLLAWTCANGLTQSVYEPYTFTTLAGLAGSAGSTDGSGGDARFDFPWGVAVDDTGNIYVADAGNSTIRKMTPAGVVTTLAGLAGYRDSSDGTGSAARFNSPYGVAVDSTGNVYVADTWNHTVRKVTPAGVVTTLAGLAGSLGSADGTDSDARFDQPSGTAVDSGGSVYVADRGNNAIRKVTSAGRVTTLAGLAGSSGTTDGTGSAARFNGPFAVAVDIAGNVYVADKANHTIRKVTPAGVVTTLAGLAGSYGAADGTGSAARFYQPYGVAVDMAGNVYVADRGNHTIRKVTPAGVVTTLAGLAGSLGSADGTGGAVRFYRPYGVAVHSDGNLYVADSENNTIRKGWPARLVLTAPIRLGDGSVQLTLRGGVGSCTILASTNLVHWSPLQTFTSTNTIPIVDSAATNHSRRFYRAVMQ
ncbi:MAG TPA: NHL repeat-containing protein [Verrucomicrobiae bacterium]